MLIVVDFEMNNYKSGNRWISDIIQIGAVKCDDSYNMAGQFNEYIKQSRKLGGIVKDITGIKDEQLNNAQSFCQAVDRFAKWIGQSSDIKFITWGKQDKTILLRQLTREDIQKAVYNRFASSEWINIQSIVTKELTILKNDLQLQDAVQYLQMQFSGEEHDALCDAFMTYRICQMRNTPEYDNYNIKNNKELLANQLLYKLNDLKTRKIEQLDKINDLRMSKRILKESLGILDDIPLDQYQICGKPSKYTKYTRLVKKLDKANTSLASIDRQIAECTRQLNLLGCFNIA